MKCKTCNNTGLVKPNTAFEVCPDCQPNFSFIWVACIFALLAILWPSGAKAQGGVTLGGIIFSQETSGREIKDVSISGDTVFIIVHDWSYQPGMGPKYGCLVSGCTSDHKWHDYTRLVFLTKPGEEKFLRREVRVEETQTVTTEQTVKRWIEKQ